MPLVIVKPQNFIFEEASQIVIYFRCILKTVLMMCYFRGWFCITRIPGCLTIKFSYFVFNTEYPLLILPCEIIDHITIKYKKTLMQSSNFPEMIVRVM